MSTEADRAAFEAWWNERCRLEPEETQRAIDAILVAQEENLPRVEFLHGSARDMEPNVWRYRGKDFLDERDAYKCQKRDRAALILHAALAERERQVALLWRELGNVTQAAMARLIDRFLQRERSVRGCLRPCGEQDASRCICKISVDKVVSDAQ